MEYLGWLFTLSILGTILFFIFSRSRFQIPGLSPLSLFLAILIFITATIFFNVIWNDLGEFLIPKGVKYSQRDFLSQRFDILLARAFYVLPLFVIAIILYTSLEKKGVKYRAVTLPYLGAAGIMVIRLLVHVGSLVIIRFMKVGIYGILISALLIFTFLIFYIQRKREERKKEEGKI